jgi:hypothetical protein
MAELGQTNDPLALIPGDVAAVTRTFWALQAYGDVLIEAGEGLAKIDTREGWQGEAADQFRQRFHGEPGRWTEAGTCFHDAARALRSHAEKLDWAQQRAKAAIELWNEGQTATAAARSEHDQAVRAAAQAGVSTAIPFSDPGEATRQAAREMLQDARARLREAGDTAAGAMAEARDKAPHKPGFLSKVGHFFSGVGRHMENAGIDLVNDVASVGNAMIEHPGDVAAIAGGTMLAGISGGGEALGTVLDATGVGSVAGVPLNAVSAVGITAGVGIAGAGAGDLLNHAANDSRVTLMKAEGDGSGGGGSAQQSAGDLLKNGQEFKGTGGRSGNKLPKYGGPKNGVLYKTNPETGAVTNYTIYDSEGRALKRVDLAGRPHAGVEPPHVVEYAHNLNPETGQVSVVESGEIRTAFPWEVP